MQHFAILELFRVERSATGMGAHLYPFRNPGIAVLGWSFLQPHVAEPVAFVLDASIASLFRRAESHPMQPSRNVF